MPNILELTLKNNLVDILGERILNDIEYFLNISKRHRKIIDCSENKALKVSLHILKSLIDIFSKKIHI